MPRKSVSDGDDSLAIDLSPMIDCIFILLIFFIVTTVFIEEPGAQINKPELGLAAEQLDKNSILIAVTRDNKVVYANKTIGVKGVGPMIKPILDLEPDVPVIIQGDNDASHGVIQQVHAEAKLAGAKFVAYSAKNQE